MTKKTAPSYEELQRRLERAESALKAIRQGQIDMEERHRKHEERLKLALDGADLATWDWQVISGRTVFDERWARMLGYTLAEIRPHFQAWEELVHPDDLPAAKAALEAHLEGETHSYEAEFRMRHKSGRWIWLLSRGRVIERDDRGAPLRICGTHLDIDEKRRAREKIRLSEELFRKFFETNLNYCYMVSPEGIILDVNTAALARLGYERKELVGQSIAVLYAPESQIKRQDVFQRWKETGQIQNEELIIQTKSGERRTVLLSASHILKADGDKLNSVSVQTDITERKRAEEALRKSKSLLDATGRMARVGGWELNPKTREVHWTEETYRIHEVPLDCKPSLEEAINFFGPAERARLSRVIRRALEYGEPYDLELRFITARGNHLWTRTICRPRMKGGKVVRLQGTFQDITDRKRAEEAFRESERRYRELFENSRDGFVVIDERGRFLDANRAYCRMLGYNLEELKAISNFHEITPARWHEWEQREIWENRLLKKGFSKVYEKEYIRKDGTVFPIEIQPYAVFNDDGRPRYLYGVVRDITERKKTETALRASEEFLSSLLNAIPIPVFYKDNNGCYLGCNKAFQAFFGISGEQLIGKTVFDINPSELAEIYFTKDNELFRTGGSQQYESQVGDAAGVLHDVIFNKAVFTDSEGNVRGLIGTIQDITGRKRSEDALREATLRQREAVKAANVGLWEWDLLTDKVRFSPEWKKQIGYEEHEIADDFREWHSRVHPDDQQSTLAKVRECIATTCQNHMVEFRFRHRDGSYRWILSQASVLPDADGRPVRMLGSHVDITERKEVEEALRKSEVKKNLILNATAELVAYYDTDLRVIWANRAASESVGLSTEELAGKHCYEIWHQRNTPCPDCPMVSVLHDKSPVTGETSTPDGRSWLLRGYPVLDDRGEVSALVEFIQDITEQKRAEEERAHLEQQFHQAQKLESIGRLAGGVAHDLNNLLAPILGYSEMLLEDVGPDITYREPLAEIVNAGKRARDLVRQLLAFSRKQTLTFKAIDLNLLLNNFDKLLRRTIREDIAIHMRLSPSLPFITGDMGQLEQVVMNLAVNAQDAMPDGGELTIETRRVELDESYAEDHEGVSPGDYVMLGMSDTGTGMDDETCSHLFEPFYTTKDQDQGTGLGLATVYGIVKQHGGNVWVYSEPGLGSTFKIYLPVSQEAPGSEEAKARSLSDARGSETILLVEDNEQVRKLTKSILERKGYNVLVADNGRRALELLSRHEGPLDLLLTDVVMPQINGKQLNERVSALYPRIRTLFMSGYTDNVIAHHGVIDSSLHFIQKPFSINVLVDKIREILDR